jgi:hypothetical protein
MCQYAPLQGKNLIHSHSKSNFRAYTNSWHRYFTLYNGALLAIFILADRQVLHIYHVKSSIWFYLLWFFVTWLNNALDNVTINKNAIHIHLCLYFIMWTQASWQLDTCLLLSVTSSQLHHVHYYVVSSLPQATIHPHSSLVTDSSIAHHLPWSSGSTKLLIFWGHLICQIQIGRTILLHRMHLSHEIQVFLGWASRPVGDGQRISFCPNRV